MDLAQHVRGVILAVSLNAAILGGVNYISKFRDGMTHSQVTAADEISFYCFFLACTTFAFWALLKWQFPQADAQTLHNG